MEYVRVEGSGWVIERYINSQLRFWGGRKTGDESFVNDSLEAVRFSREEDAAKVLAWCFEGHGRVAEHVWTEEAEVAHAMRDAPENQPRE